MHKFTILGASVALMLAPVAALAQQQPAQPPAAAAPAPDTQPAAPKVQTISVVDIKELPAEAQSAVNDVVAQRSEAELKEMRDTIEANAVIKQALNAKGATSDQVIAASLGKNGALTLITKKPS